MAGRLATGKGGEKANGSAAGQGGLETVANSGTRQQRRTRREKRRVNAEVERSRKGMQGIWKWEEGKQSATKGKTRRQREKGAESEAAGEISRNMRGDDERTDPTEGGGGRIGGRGGGDHEPVACGKRRSAPASV